MTLIAIALVVALLVGSLWGVWLAHESAKAEQAKQAERDRLRLHAAVGVTEARPWTAKAAKGFSRTRVIR